MAGDVATVSFRRVLSRYLIGFAGALGLTITAFAVEMSHGFMGGWLTAILVALALVQLGVQLVFFLHLGEETKPRWQLTAFLFTVVLVFVVVAGSLWIMYHLNYNMMRSPQQMDDYMKAQYGKGGF